MRATPGTKKDPHDGVPLTLADLLYPGQSQSRSSEREWFALIQSIAGGDQQALHELYERTHRLIFTLVVRMTNCQETAEELTLDVLHDVWRRAATYAPTSGSVLGWIMNQARSRAIDRLRFERRKKRSNPDGDGWLEPPAAGDSEEMLVLRQQGERLRDALSALTEDERVAIEIAFFSDLTYAEVAERLNQPTGTVKSRIRSGLSKLRQALDSGVKTP